MTTARAAAFALASVLAAGCAAFDPNDLLSRQLRHGGDTANAPVPSPADGALGEAKRAAALEFVWTTIRDRYYDPSLKGVDWNAARERWGAPALVAATDEDFWRLLDRMAGELRDSHTRVESPRRAAEIARFESVGFGFTLRPVGDRLAVTGVNRESDAFWSGVRPGMTLAEVGGEPAQAAWARALGGTREGSTAQAKHLAAVRHLLEGEPGSRSRFVFTRGDGTTFSATLPRTRALAPPRVTHRRLPSGWGYLRLTSWSQSLQAPMIAAIEALHDAPGLVIDLRGNPGGSALMVRNVAAQFFEGTVEFGRAITRTGRPITIAFDWIEVIKLKQAFAGTGTYRRPVAVLVDSASGSASELFAGILQSRGRAAIVGQTTCGCLLAYLGYAEVPGGGRLAYSEVGFVFPDGRRIEGEGVVPDVPVPVALADLLAERDRSLEEAQAWLGRK